jgi:hypothetical protein
MVRVALKVVEQNVADQVVTVRGVLGLATQIAAGSIFLAQQTIVLYIAHNLQQGGPIQALQNQK